MPDDTWMRPVIERDAVRAIVLTEEGDVLLMQLRSPEGKPFWITPGGGLERHEEVEVGLRRELHEELGLDSFDVGPLVWRRQHTFDWDGKRFCQREHYYVIHVSRFEPLMSDPVESARVERFGWWTRADLQSTAEEVVPISLAEIIDRYLTQGPPSDLPEWEVLID